MFFCNVWRNAIVRTSTLDNFVLTGLLLTHDSSHVMIIHSGKKRIPLISRLPHLAYIVVLTEFHETSISKKHSVSTCCRLSHRIGFGAIHTHPPTKTSDSLIVCEVSITGVVIGLQTENGIKLFVEFGTQHGSASHPQPKCIIRCWIFSIPYGHVRNYVREFIVGMNEGLDRTVVTRRH